MTTLNSDIRARVEAFVSEMTALLHQSAVDAAVIALQATTAGARPAATANTLRAAVRNVVSTKASPSAKQAPSKSVGRARKSPARRSPKQIDGTVSVVLAYVKAHPGERSENIRKALKLERPLMTDAVKRLIAAKKLAAKGQKRATTYSAL